WTQATVVREGSIVGISVPGWHTLGTNHFANHGRETANHVVFVHGEGGNTTWAVTVHTLVDEDRRNIFGVGDLRVFRTTILLRQVDQTALGISVSQLDRFTGQNCVQRISDIVV